MRANAWLVAHSGDMNLVCWACSNTNQTRCPGASRDSCKQTASRSKVTVVGCTDRRRACVAPLRLRGRARVRECHWWHAPGAPPRIQGTPARVKRAPPAPRAGPGAWWWHDTTGRHSPQALRPAINWFASHLFAGPQCGRYAAHDRGSAHARPRSVSISRQFTCELTWIFSTHNML